MMSELNIYFRPKYRDMRRGVIIYINVLLFCPLLLFAQISIGPIDDSYIFQGGDKADNIYGLLNPDELITRQSVASSSFTREAYCMFEIGGRAESFSDARIQLYGNVLAEKTVEVYFSDTTWSEETLTGSNRPAGSYIGSTSVLSGEAYSSWDVTIYVNLARSSGANKVSFVFKDVADDVSSSDTKWHSKENPSGNSPRLILTPGEAPEVYNGTYFIDQINGSDDSTGHSPEEAWKTLANISNLVLQPGDSLLFKSGCTWTGTFSLSGSGLPGKPVVIGKYGGEQRPIINGAGMGTNTLTLKDQHHIVVRDLAITNFGPTEDFRRGIYYQATDLGEIRFVVFDNLEVYDVNGIIDEEINRFSKNNGGIFFEISGSSIPTWFDTLVISNCHIHDVNRTGISNASYWDNRTLHENENWVPSKNVHIHHNTFERTGANALIVRVADKPLMEFNLFDHCSIHWTGNASFSFNTDSAIWQYNEARYTKYNPGDNDAGGFDSDFRAKHTIIQYNYSHHNGYGGVLLTGGPGSGSGFNDGTIVRYNVFANNEHHNFRTSGNLTNSQIYNNVIYTGPDLKDVMQVYHKSWGGTYSDSTLYWNNIFYNEGDNTSFNLTGSTNNEFLNNIYYGNPIDGQPYDPAAITADPKLVNPGGDLTGFEAVLQYALAAGSSAIDKGMPVEGNDVFDIVRNMVPTGEAPDIGAFEWQADSVDVIIIVKDENLSPVEGAEVWIEGYGSSTSDASGESMFNKVLRGDDIPLTIAYSNYPILAGSLELNSADTLTFFLSKNTWDLRIMISDTAGTPIENVQVSIPGIGTFLSDDEGEVLFSGLTESDNILFRTAEDRYHYNYGKTALVKHDTASISISPRWISIEVRDSENMVIKDALVSMEGYGALNTDASGRAIFYPIAGNDTLQYTVEKAGYVSHSGELIIGEDNLSVSAIVEVSNVYFLVTDDKGKPLNLAAISFLNQVKFTGSDGIVEFIGIPFDEDLAYSVYQSGYISQTGSALLTKPGETIRVEMKLVTFRVDFIISDKSGTEIEGALVTLSGYGVMITDQAGSATFPEVNPAENILYAISKTGYRDSLSLLALVDKDVLLNIKLVSDVGNSLNPELNLSPIRIFPNPASELVSIPLSEQKGVVNIFNQRGSLVYNKKTKNEFIEIDISSWEPGIYYVDFHGEKERTVIPLKFIVL